MERGRGQATEQVGLDRGCALSVELYFRLDQLTLLCLFDLAVQAEILKDVLPLIRFPTMEVRPVVCLTAL
jgi:hypothetical protein